MLATFVIGLREGLEAALIVGIIAAFLAQDGKSRALRLMWTGVALAVLLWLGIGITLAVLSGSLPHRRQEMLETVTGWSRWSAIRCTWARRSARACAAVACPAARASAAATAGAGNGSSRSSRSSRQARIRCASHFVGDLHRGG